MFSEIIFNKSIFKFCESPILTQWCHFEVFIIVSLKSKIFAEVPSRKISGFYYKWNIQLYLSTSSLAYLFAITGRRKNYFFKITLRKRLLFCHEETEGTAPYISLKIPGSFTRLLFQSLFSKVTLKLAWNLFLKSGTGSVFGKVSQILL